MAMDTRMILAGRGPDVMGSYGRGLEVGQFGNQVRQENALRSLYAAQGPQIMQGQPNALNALATLSPGLAMDAQGAILNQQQTRQDMAFSAEEMQMRRAQAKAQAEAMLAQNQATLDAVTAEQHQRDMMGILAGGAAAHDAGPEAFTAWSQQNGVEVPFNMFPAWAAQTAGEIDALDDWVKVAPKPAKGPTYRPATPEEAARYGAQAGQINTETGQFSAINPPSGMSLETTAEGGVRVVQGPGAGAVRPLTEAQSKDNVFVTRARGALEVLDPIAGALTSYGDQLMGLDPTGIVRGQQSERYQTAVQAGNEFLQAILRKDTGAAITADEQELYGKTYLPQPGDGPAVLAQKERSRARALAAMEAGMSQEQVATTERALVEAAKRSETGATPAQEATPAPGTVLRFDAQGNLLP